MADTETMLYHIGCGRPLFSREAAQRDTMAMACGYCGAPAPIVAADLNAQGVLGITLPASLVIATRAGGFAKEAPHIEYYLGFSDFTCPAKESWERELRTRFGMVSFSECDKPGCIRTPARERERIAKREARRRG